MGYKCEQLAQLTPVACQKGYYQNAVAQTTCLDCPIGSFCHLDATITPEVCDAGYLCPNANLDEKPYHLHATYSCPRGYYCEQPANVATACVAGTYQPKYGATSIADCISTPAGFYTATDASYEFYQYKCPAAFFCP